MPVKNLTIQWIACIALSIVYYAEIVFMLIYTVDILIYYDDI